jgi:hypothetical protein
MTTKFRDLSRAEQRAVLAEKYGDECQFPNCDVTGIDFLTIHHIIPKFIGGADTPRNMCLMCEEHHRAIHKFIQIPFWGHRRGLHEKYADAWAAIHELFEEINQGQGQGVAL